MKIFVLSKLIYFSLAVLYNTVFNFTNGRNCHTAAVGNMYLRFV